MFTIVFISQGIGPNSEFGEVLTEFYKTLRGYSHVNTRRYW